MNEQENKFMVSSNKEGEGNGSPLQYSCLENPMDGGAWWAAVHGVTELDTTERLLFHFSPSCIGKGNGNPLQCSCLENPRDRGAWWAAISGVSQHQIRLQQLSSSSSNNKERGQEDSKECPGTETPSHGPDNLCRVLSNFALDQVRLEDWRLNILMRGVKGNNANIHHNNSPYVPSITSSAFREWTRLHNPNSLEVLPLALGHSKWLWSYSSEVEEAGSESSFVVNHHTHQLLCSFYWPTVRSRMWKAMVFIEIVIIASLGKLNICLEKRICKVWGRFELVPFLFTHTHTHTIAFSSLEPYSNISISWKLQGQLHQGCACNQLWLNNNIAKILYLEALTKGPRGLLTLNSCLIHKEDDEKAERKAELLLT